MFKSSLNPVTRTPASADVPSHQLTPLGVRLVCRSIRQTFDSTQHRPSNGLPAAGVSVSSRPHQGFAHAGRCVQIAGGLAVLGFLMHGSSVAKHSLSINGVLFSKVDIWN
jgi:hypothetical protein